MGLLTAIEDYIDLAFERLFQSSGSLDFGRMERQVLRLAESKRLAVISRQYLPNRFKIELNPGDFDKTLIFHDDYKANLVKSLSGLAQTKGYALLRPVWVDILANQGVKAGCCVVAVQLTETKESDIKIDLCNTLDGQLTVVETSKESPCPHETILATVLDHVQCGELEKASRELTVLETEYPDQKALSGLRLALQNHNHEDHLAYGPLTVVNSADSPVKPADVIKIAWGDQHFHICRQSMIIGRGKDCSMVLNDPMVSARHLRLTYVDGRATIDDLASANGIWLDGRKIISQLIEPGEHSLQLGPDTYLDIIVTAAKDRFGCVRVRQNHKTFLVTDSGLSIGRTGGSGGPFDLSSPDPTVTGQRAHAHLMFDPLRVMDNDSTNGLKVNGQRVSVTHLKAGVGVEIGDDELNVVSRPFSGLI